MLPMAKPAISGALCGRRLFFFLQMPTPLTENSSATSPCTFSSPCSALGSPFDLLGQISDSPRAPNINRPAIDRVRQGPEGSAFGKSREEGGCYAICLVRFLAGLCFPRRLPLTSTLGLPLIRLQTGPVKALCGL